MTSERVDECAAFDSHRPVPAPFLTKTYQLVDDESTDEIVSWADENVTFVVWKPMEFARDLLPNYFKHNNFSSFVRQLNTYGFRKVVPDRWEFGNEFFRKGAKSLLCEIQRRKTSSSMPIPLPASLTPRDDRTLSSGSPTPSFDNQEAVMVENDRLRRHNLILIHELANIRHLYIDLLYTMQNSNQNQPGNCPVVRDQLSSHAFHKGNAFWGQCYPMHSQNAFSEKGPNPLSVHAPFSSLSSSSFNSLSPPHAHSHESEDENDCNDSVSARERILEEAVADMKSKARTFPFLPFNKPVPSHIGPGIGNVPSNEANFVSPSPSVISKSCVSSEVENVGERSDVEVDHGFVLGKRGLLDSEGSNENCANPGKFPGKKMLKREEDDNGVGTVMDVRD